MCLQALINQTWDSQYIGVGKDGNGMTHDRAEVSRVWRIENDHLWQLYATTRSQIESLNAHSPQLPPIASMAGAAACWTDSLGLQTARNEVMLFSGAPPLRLLFLIQLCHHPHVDCGLRH